MAMSCLIDPHWSSSQSSPDLHLRSVVDPCWSSEINRNHPKKSPMNQPLESISHGWLECGWFLWWLIGEWWFFMMKNPWGHWSQQSKSRSPPRLQEAGPLHRSLRLLQRQRSAVLRRHAAPRGATGGDAQWLGGWRLTATCWFTHL